MQEVIKLSYYGTRPYNRMYVGFKSINCPCGATTRTTHFDGQFDNKWYNAVARLVYEFIQEYPQRKFEYIDVVSVELTSNLSYEDVRKLIITADDYRNIRPKELTDVFGEDCPYKSKYVEIDD